MSITNLNNRLNSLLTTPPSVTQAAVPSVPTPIQEEEGPGFLSTMWTEIKRPVIGLAQDVSRLHPDVRAADRSIQELRQTDLPAYMIPATEAYLSIRGENAEPEVRKKLELAVKNNALADQLQEMIGGTPTVKKVVGDALGTTLTVAPLPIGKIGAAFKALKISSPWLRASLTGGAYMAAFGGADAMAQKKDAAGIAESMGWGALAGGVTGPAVHLLGKGFTRMVSLKPFSYLYNRITDSEATKVFGQWVRPVSSVLSKDFGEVGDAIVKRLLAADSNIQLALGRTTAVARKIGAIFPGDEAGREASYQLGRILRGRGVSTAETAGLETGELTGRIGQGGKMGFGAREALTDVPIKTEGLTPEQYYRALWGDLASEAQGRGIMTRTPPRGGKPGYWQNFEPQENYFPQQVPAIPELKGKYPFETAEQAMNARMANIGVSKDVLQKTGIVDGRLRKWVIRNAVEDGRFATEEQAAIALDGYIEFIEKEGVGVSKNNGWINYLVSSGQAADEGAAYKIMNRAIENKGLVKLGGSLENAKILDNPWYNPFPDEVAPLYVADSLTRLENIEQFGVKYKGDTAKFPEIEKAINKVRTEQGKKAAQSFDEFLGIALNRINTSTRGERAAYFLRMTQVPKLTFASIINVGQSVLNPLLTADMKATFSGLRKAFASERVQQALESGATMQAIMNEAATATAGGGNFADKYLKAVGFIWTEKFNRTVSASIGQEWVVNTFDRLLKDPKNMTYVRRLEELGISAEKALTRGSLTGNDILKASQKFAEKTQFRSRPMDLPAWTASPVGKVFWQFRNFSYQQTKFIYNELAKEIASKSYGRAARDVLVLATIFPMVGEVLQDFRSFVTGSKRPTNLLERYWSDIAGSGALGLISDFVNASRYDQSDRMILPPVLGSIQSLWNAVDDPTTFAKEAVKQTGVLTPVVNYTKKRQKGSENMWETTSKLFD